MLLLPPSMYAQTGCVGNGQTSTMKFLVGGFNGPAANDTTVNVGQTLYYQVTVGVPADGSCPATNVDAYVKFADGTVVQFLSHATLNQGQSITCPGDSNCINTNDLKYTVRAQDVGQSFSLGEPNGLPGTGTNTCFVAPVPNRVGAILNAVGVSQGDTTANTYSSCNNITAVVLQPCIACVKNCSNAIGEHGLIAFTGSVSNCSAGVTATVLNNVNVSNLVNGVLTLVTNIPVLDIGQSVAFSASYANPNICQPVTDTIFVSGTEPATVPDQYRLTVNSTCEATCSNVFNPGISVTKFCPSEPTEPGGILTFSGTVSNAGNISLTNVTVINDRVLTNGSTLVASYPLLTNGESRSFTGSYLIPADSCGPYTDTVLAWGTAICGGSVTNTDTAICPGTNAPAIAVSKSCPAGLIEPGQELTITGTVTNTGNITLTNVTVTNAIAVLGETRRVLGPITLAPGGWTNFTDSYHVPLNSCGPYRDTVTASGADKCFGRIVTASDFKDCPGTNAPAIAVAKHCPTNAVPPGGILIITGVVTNTGNITLTNVTVTNVIAALGQSHGVLGPITLAPGGWTNFTDSYQVPLDSCGPYRDTVTASGADKCFGRIVTATDFKDCSGITTPRIAVFKHCPTNPVSPGDIAVFTGTVSNAGNITLTNVIVVNNRPTNNTPVLGPISLAPGQAVNFSGSEVVPANCCTYFDTLTATGNSKCTGSNVTATATAVCPTITSARLVVTKHCPPAPVPLGQTLVFSGTVSNAGNITLTNVTVVNTQPNNNTPVFGPLTLAPGELASFTGSYGVPIDICDTNISDTLTARGNNNCTGSNVTATFTASCPIIALPRLTVTKQCPAHPVAPGELLVYSGFVSNSGNITITNVFVVNDRPAKDTPVVGPITNLPPGQAVNFTGSYLAPYDCCGPCVDTLTAQGQEVCAGSNVTATASAACPRTTTPRITVTRDCPPEPATLGDLVFLFGSVSNAGNATLGGVVVTDDQAGVVLDNLALAPGESVPYFGMYILTNCGPALASGVTATGSDICTGNAVSNRFVSSRVVICPNVPPVTIVNPGVEGEFFVFSFLTELNRTYTVEFTDSLSPTVWQSLTSFLGNGTMATILDSRTNTQRFYRVQVQ